MFSRDMLFNVCSYIIFIPSEIGKTDDYTPLCVTSLEQLTEELHDFPFENEADLDVFPKMYPFSVFVPRIYAEVLNFYL